MVRPSQLAGVDDPYVAYCLDEAVGEFGAFVTAELETIGLTPKETKKMAQDTAKRLQVLNRLLGIPHSKRQYRQPGRG